MATMAPSPSSRDVPVTITIDPSGKITVTPDTFYVSKSKNQEVVWGCSDPNAYFTVEFNKNGSPFYESQFSKDHPCSGLVRRDVLPEHYRIYDYTVRVGGKSLDPGGGVDQ